MLNQNKTLRGLVDNSTVAMQASKAPEGYINSRLTQLEGYLQEIHDGINETAFRLTHVLQPMQAGCGEESGGEPKSVLSPLADRLETILQSARIARESLTNLANRINI